jgi:hypothetical protein
VATNGYAQVAPDSTGKRIANFAIVLPVGTLVSDADGTQTALSAATTVFVQRVALTDSSGNAIDQFIGNDRQDEVLRVLRKILAVVGKIGGDELQNEDDQEL